MVDTEIIFKDKENEMEEIGNGAVYFVLEFDHEIVRNELISKLIIDSIKGVLFSKFCIFEIKTS